jgi:hypothetical protein
VEAELKVQPLKKTRKVMLRTNIPYMNYLESISIVSLQRKNTVLQYINWLRNVTCPKWCISFCCISSASRIFQNPYLDKLLVGKETLTHLLSKSTKVDFIKLRKFSSINKVDLNILKLNLYKCTTYTAKA